MYILIKHASINSLDIQASCTQYEGLESMRTGNQVEILAMVELFFQVQDVTSANAFKSESLVPEEQAI